MLRVPENYEIRNPVLRRVVNEAKAEERNEILDRIRAVVISQAAGKGVVLSQDHHAVVANCQDEAKLAAWIAQLAVGESADDIFGVTADVSRH